MEAFISLAAPGTVGHRLGFVQSLQCQGQGRMGLTGLRTTPTVREIQYKVKVSSFPGCITNDMADHIRAIVRRDPDSIIIHVGTNRLRSINSVNV